MPWRKLGKDPLIIHVDRIFLVVGPKAAAPGYNEENLILAKIDTQRIVCR